MNTNPKEMVELCLVDMQAHEIELEIELRKINREVSEAKLKNDGTYDRLWQEQWHLERSIQNFKWHIHGLEKLLYGEE